MILKNIYPLLRNMPARFRLLLVMVSALVLLAACGGGTTANTTSVAASATTANTPTAGANSTTTVAPPTPTPTAVQPTPKVAPPTPTPTAVQPTPKVAQSSTQTVMIVTNSDGSYAFSPTMLTIKPGTTVVWRNASSAPHTVTTDDGSTADSRTVAVGATFHFTFTTPGTFSYHCNYHPYMRARIVVV